MTGNDVTVMQDRQGTIHLSTMTNNDRSNTIDHSGAYTPASLDSSLEFIDETPQIIPKSHSQQQNHVTRNRHHKTTEIEEGPLRPTFDTSCYEVLLRLEHIVSLTKEALIKLVDHATNKDSRRDMKDEKALEWHIVAVAIDRLFFFIYLGMIIILLLIATALIFPRKF